MQFPNHEWAQLDFLQGFDENPRELPQPTFNEHPPLHNANHTPPEPLLEPPMAAEQPSKPSPVSPGTNDYRYTCQPCPFSSNIKRDYNRHLRTHKHKKNTRIGGSNSPLEPIESDTTGFHCLVLGCKFGATGKMFTREDNVWRHIRKVHDIQKQL